MKTLTIGSRISVACAVLVALAITSGGTALLNLDHIWIWMTLAITLSAGVGLSFMIVRSVNGALAQACTQLRDGVAEMTTAAKQVSSSGQGLAQGASEQAASLEETSASAQEITSMTRKNAENSKTAAGVMAEVERNVANGNQALEQMVTSMEEITASSDKISKIIKVIDEIAFQTNILALNAAVEAARAGESGMGFAVVADEVRNLAQRSAQAAKDTAALIEESISKSNEGGAKLGQVAGVIHAITASASKVKTLVDEVNVGSQEQARGIEQISRAVVQMDQLTQSTAANAEESASASEEMAAQAESLMKIISGLAALVGSGSSKRDRNDVAASMTEPLTKNLAGLKSAMKPAGGLRIAQAPLMNTAGDIFPMEGDFREM